jgi:hypothetical protein
MTDVIDLSMRLSTVRKQIKKAHRVPETWTEEMEHTAEAIDSLGIQHYARAGEDMPERIIEAQVRAMADLTFAYAEQAYEAKGDELTFFDDGERERFDDHLDRAHDAAMKSVREIEDDD